MLSTLTGALLMTGVWGHGRLTKPMTRIGSESAYENDPAQGSQFICRHKTPNPNVTPTQVAAGGKLDLNWKTTAAHVGDCAFYMSYDVDKSLEDMTWFKIGNMQSCKDFQLQDNPIDLPSWLPGGAAVFRWEWYALHVFPTIEYYSQCADLEVIPTSNAILPSNIPTFKVYENGARISLPENGNDGVGFRNAFDDNGNQDMTGPECALGSTLNNCALTAEGTSRHVDVNAQVTDPVVVPTNDPGTPEPTNEQTEDPSPEPTTEEPTEMPAPSADPTNPPADDPTYPPSDNEDACAKGSLYDAFAQCDGDGFAAASGNCQACPTGYQCFKKGQWYSNCNTACPTGLGWECEADGDSPAATQPPTEPTPADGSCPNGEHDTCGGEGNEHLPSCCPDGMTCTVYSKWHSQCVKDQ